MHHFVGRERVMIRWRHVDYKTGQHAIWNVTQNGIPEQIELSMNLFEALGYDFSYFKIFGAIPFVKCFNLNLPALSFIGGHRCCGRWKIIGGDAAPIQLVGEHQ